jgi:hypothetical protein
LAFFIRSTTAATIRGGGCGIEISHWPLGLLGWLDGVNEIIGVLVSAATTAIATVPGTPDVPISTSTFSSSTSLRALRVAAEGSDASSSRISLIVVSPSLP